MADVTFNGTTIPFGRVQSRPHDYELKTWAFPGVDGSDFMSMGFRGRLFSVSGRSVTGIAAIAKSTIEGFVDGTAHTLVEADSTSHANCICTGFRITEQYTDQNGFCFIFELMVIQVEI